MKSSFFGIGLLVLFCASLEAATYYMSPTGNDAGAGTAIGAPLKTFAVAIRKLRPGDVLILLDGTYNASNSGWIRMDTVKGTAAAPITIKAMNQRKAWLKGDGAAHTVLVQNSAYITFDGLRVSSADLPPLGGPDAQNMYILRSNYMVFRNLILHNANRYRNSHLLLMEHVNFCLVEDVEAYYFHRHAIDGTDCNDTEIRRIYANHRHGNIAGSGGYSNGADMAWTTYPGSRNRIQNLISEGFQSVFDIQAFVRSQDNQYLGIVSLGGRGAIMRAREDALDPITAMPLNNTVRDYVFIRTAPQPEFFALMTRSGRGNVCDHCSNFGAHWGYNANKDGAASADGRYGFHVRNSLSVGGAHGFYFDGEVTADNDFSVTNSNAYGASISPAYPASNPRYSNLTTINPQMGTCYLWVPAGSPMKGAGTGGSDIGATVLYRYENGVLTNKPLWDPQTGAFPCGAIVPGLNDVAGQSCFDVHKRLNVNCNSCPFPDSYPKPGTTSAITPAKAGSTWGQAFLTITPNFAGSSINVKTDAQHPAMVEIYNLQGKKIEQFKNVRASSIQWQRGNLPAGMYFVKASSRGITATAKAMLGR